MEGSIGGHNETRLTVSPVFLRRVMWLSDDARRNGIHWLAGPGAGKSRGLGRLLAWMDFVRGSPQIILDPTGGTIDNFLDRMLQLPPEMQKRLWPRILYVDLGASDYVVPMPLYKRRHAGESWFAVANRPLEVFRRIDPHLATASVEGWNALFEIGIYMGQIAAVLGLQVTEVADLIRRPKQWKTRLEALRDDPELQSALIHFNEYARLKPDLQRRRSGSLLTKLMPFLTDPTMQAVFAADREGIDIGAVDRGCLTLLIDGRNEHDAVRRQFKLLWIFRLVTDYLKERGMAGRERPIGFVIDEVTQLLGFHSVENTVMAEDLEELVSVLARNYGCNLTIAHQSLTQIASERIRNVLMQMGTQIIGLIHNPDDSEYLARHFLQYDPYKVKKEEPVWMSVQQMINGISQPTIIDWTTSEFTPEEQMIKMGERFRNLPRFHFLVRRAANEGSIGQGLQRVNIGAVDAGRYPDDAQIAVARQQLRQRDGIPVDTLLAEIQDRPNRLETAKPKTEDAILKENRPDQDAPRTDNLPAKTERTERREATSKGQPPKTWQDDLWKQGGG